MVKRTLILADWDILRGERASGVLTALGIVKRSMEGGKGGGEGLRKCRILYCD